MIVDDFTRLTGDPFIDTGGIVIKVLSLKYPQKDILELIKFATDIYVKNWGGKLHTFFLNSSITQSAFKSDRKVLETINYYNSLIQETNEIYKVGYCRILGVETKLYQAGRHNHMMSASGSFINFHSAYDDGLYLSKEALIRIFFVPLGVCFVGDKIALIQSNNDEMNERLIQNTFEENERNLASKISEGVLKSDFGMVSNALFNYADFCISQSEVIIKNVYGLTKSDVQLNLYHFTNFGASPTVDLHTFSDLLFKFYAICKTRHAKQWNSFVNQHYKYSKFKGAQFDSEKQEWFNEKGRLKYDDYKAWYNPILNELLLGKPILSRFLKWGKKNRFEFNIVEIYCLNILKMEKYTIQKIKELSSFIIDDKSDDEIKGAITRLNAAKNSGLLRAFLLKLIKENYAKKHKEPLITVEDYVLYLFPEGFSWKDTRDLLLIAIYQKLHEMEKIIADIQTEEQDEEESN
jgi:CRISPR-associated protein Cst1